MQSSLASIVRLCYISFQLKFHNSEFIAQRIPKKFILSFTIQKTYLKFECNLYFLTTWKFQIKFKLIKFNSNHQKPLLTSKNTNEKIKTQPKLNEWTNQIVRIENKDRITICIKFPMKNSGKNVWKTGVRNDRNREHTWKPFLSAKIDSIHWNHNRKQKEAKKNRSSNEIYHRNVQHPAKRSSKPKATKFCAFHKNTIFHQQIFTFLWGKGEKQLEKRRKGEENTVLPHPESPETNRDVTTTAAATVIAELLTHRHHYNHHTAGYFTFTAITHLHNGEKPGESSSNGISRLARGSKQNTTRNRHSHQSRERTIRQMMTFTWT